MSPEVAAIVVGVAVAIAVAFIAGLWGMFTKAGRPGWHAVIPILNSYVWVKILGRPGWLAILSLFPPAAFLILILVSFDTAKSFGKKPSYAFGLILLPFVFFPMLGFGRAKYVGPATDDTRPTMIG